MRKILFSCTALVGLLAISALLAAEQRTLYETSSVYNKRIVVTEGPPGVRTLWFEEGGSRQSTVKKDDPDYLELRYTRAMPIGLAVRAGDDQTRAPANDVLIIGLGGGTIPRFLHEHFPKMMIDIVDIDPKVVDVARRFFWFRENQQVHVHVADGRDFIQKQIARGKRYHIIFLDAFGPDEIPRSLTTCEFLQSVRTAISDDGIVVANVWDRYSNSDYDSMIRTYQHVFADLYIVDVHGTGNEIVIALPHLRNLSRAVMVRRARDVSRRYRFPYDMAELVRDGFRVPGGDGKVGHILRDVEQE